jgi:hypothetical protein
MTDTRKDALAVMMDKVRTGTAIETDFAEAWPNATQSEHSNAWLAYIGSLDGAKQLHDAALPDRGWEIYRTAKYPGMIPGSSPYPFAAKVGWGTYHTGEADTASRAWLIAILSALIAQAQP